MKSPIRPAGSRSRRRRRRRVVAAGIALAIAAAGFGLYRQLEGEPLSSPGLREVRSVRVRGLDPCDVPMALLERASRGYFPERSGDVLNIEWAPNQLGGRRHSTPWPYIQKVPLVLYGPGFVRQGIESDRPATLVDLAPTFAELMGFDEFPERDGSVLQDALVPASRRAGVPRLLVTLVWDGGGQDVLAQWPDSWPTLSKLLPVSTSYPRATVGSSPSITPAVHATIGSGAWPSTHGVPDMVMRVDDGIVPSWAGSSPRRLRVPTLGDLWDLATNNLAQVGAVARDPHHLGMLGRGALHPGGDADIAAVFHDGTTFETNEAYYRLAAGMDDPDALVAAIEHLDQRDGEADGRWRGVELDAADPFLHYTPAWSVYQTGRIADLIETEGFGADEIPDLLYVNYKGIDLAGHQWNLDRPELREHLEEIDRQLAELIALLDRVAPRSYVLALTADHGVSPSPEPRGGWAISGDELVADVQARFDGTPDDSPLLRINRGYQLFLDRREMRRHDVTAADISAWLRDYRIGDNAATPEDLGPFAPRKSERIFITSVTPTELEAALACARSKARG